MEEEEPEGEKSGLKDNPISLSSEEEVTLPFNYV